METATTPAMVTALDSPNPSISSFNPDDFVVQFWGVRGSIPTPGKSTIRYGGNTSCLEMRVAGKRLIFDGGTGLRMLGDAMMAEMPIEAYMFFTHYHWDHIQGFPLFTPAFLPGNCFHIYGSIPPQGESMKKHFIERVLHPNSSVPLKGLQADLRFYELKAGDSMMLDDIKIETGQLNHPNTAMGYRITWNGRSVVYCSDTEHLPDGLDENVLNLSQDADVLIYDAMYTDEEYHSPKSPKVGWGHSTWQEAVKMAEAAGVKRVVIFHHDPTHSDDFLDQIEQEVQAVFPKAIMAREGLVVPIGV
ncbi:MBL fold metallo-hydrolase [Lyngbya sp. PCC 8106]|uniref:MBL fold metallo-hydrolase n=1 Tax=Lyngbya sp. (strain PCC 8106) TaxID=313612 RepID=UPI0000EAC73E|nr:MBL fold metallo-hydrolase [Lyngbya sp. PCC 8106]EAW38687.1 Beta-lactamase-like protein [Lyngbya sp. PCC 8106]